MAFKLVTILVENKNLSPMPFVIDHICVPWASENYGSTAIKISLIQTSKHDDFLCIQV